MLNWKSLFKSHILERGHDYYELRNISNLTKTAKGYSAIVCGTEDYEVEVELQDEEYSHLWCSCPHAEEGNYCKHMAAVLYELEESEIDEPEVYDMRQEVQSVLEGIGEIEVKKFLLELVGEDAAMGSR